MVSLVSLFINSDRPVQLTPPKCGWSWGWSLATWAAGVTGGCPLGLHKWSVCLCPVSWPKSCLVLGDNLTWYCKCYPSRAWCVVNKNSITSQLRSPMIPMMMIRVHKWVGIILLIYYNYCTTSIYMQTTRNTTRLRYLQSARYMQKVESIPFPPSHSVWSNLQSLPSFPDASSSADTSVIHSRSYSRSFVQSARSQASSTAQAGVLSFLSRGRCVRSTSPPWMRGLCFLTQSFLALSFFVIFFSVASRRSWMMSQY